MEQTKFRGIIELVNARSTDVVKEMTHWNERYRHYRSADLPGIWECKILKHGEGTISYQFIDQVFEVGSRGLKATEISLRPKSVLKNNIH